MWEDVVVVFVLMVFAIPIVAILTEHQRKMAELKQRAPEERRLNAGGELAALREQLTDLRDLTTKYDLSFDQALQRIESRVASLEGRMTALEQSSVATERHAG